MLRTSTTTGFRISELKHGGGKMGKRNLSDRVKKELCAKSGNRCAFPGCPNNLYSSEASVGEICHIEGLNPGAVR